MNAITTKPTTVNTFPAPAGGALEATAPTGHRMITAAQCQYGNVIRADDLLHVNFDVREVRGPGLYLLEAPGRDWTCCHRLTMNMQGTLDIDNTGDGVNWHTVPSLETVGLRVIGYIERVYRPVAH